MGRSRWTPDALLGLGALAALVIAGISGPSAPSRLPAAFVSARAQVLGLPSTGSTALWLRAVPTFGQAVVDHARHQAPLRAGLEPVHQDLVAATRLDPSFEAPWLGGALMLQVLEQGAGPRGRALSTRGRQLRPDLPWALLDAPEVAE